MLLRLYHPLLFRDLAAANAGVRNNAMQLMIDAFPLQDSVAPAEVDHSFLSLSKHVSFVFPWDHARSHANTALTASW